MADAKPPRLVADERATVLALLQYQRESFVRNLSGVREDDARRVLVPNGASGVRRPPQVPVKTRTDTTFMCWRKPRRRAYRRAL
jgi:hypothetical protein